MFLAKQVVLGVVEQSSAPGMALYPICQTSIHNTEFCHGCFTNMIVYQSMLRSFISYATVLVRPDDPGTDRGSLYTGTRVVTSYTSVVLGYAGSFRYDRAPPCDWGRRHEVTAMSIRRNSGVVFNVFPDARVRCRSSCKEVTGLEVLQCGTRSSPVRDLVPAIPIFWHLQP